MSVRNFSRTHDRISTQSVPLLPVLASSRTQGKHPLTIELINKYWYSIHPTEYYTALTYEEETIWESACLKCSKALGSISSDPQDIASENKTKLQMV